MQQNSNLKKDVFSGFIWKFMERVASQGVSMVVSIILARLLTPEDYSVVGVVAIFFTVCNVIISGGLNTALIQKKNADIEDYSTVLNVSIILATVMYAIMFFAAPWIADLYHKEVLIPVVRVMSLTLFINAFNSVLSAYTSSQLQFRNFFTSSILGTVVSAIVGITMALKGYGAWALVVQQMTSALAGTLVLFWMTHMRFIMKISLERLKTLFGYGSKIFLSSIITVVYDQINPLIVGLKFSSTDLAYYTKGIGYPGLLNSTISDTLSAVLFPAMSKLQHDKEAVLQMTRQYIRVASYVVFPIMLGFFAVSDKFVTAVLTDKWLPIVPYIRVFCFSYMFNIIHVGNLQAIKAIGRSDISLKLEIIKKSIFLAVVTAFVLLAKNPIILALSSIVTTMIATVVNTYPNRKLIGYRYRYQILDLVPNFILAVVMGMAVMLIGQLELPALALMLLQIVSGAVIYVLLSVLTRNPNFKYLLDYIKIMVKRSG